MHIHPSTYLEGPASAARPWWRELDATAPRPDDKLDRPLPEEDPDFRADLVARIRREIAAGTYGTDAQLEEALARLLNRLDQGGP